MRTRSSFSAARSKHRRISKSSSLMLFGNGRGVRFILAFHNAHSAVANVTFKCRNLPPQRTDSCRIIVPDETRKGRVLRHGRGPFQFLDMLVAEPHRSQILVATSLERTIRPRYQILSLPDFLNLGCQARNRLL